MFGNLRTAIITALLFSIAFIAPTSTQANISEEHKVIRGSDGVLYISTELKPVTTQQATPMPSGIATISAKQPTPITTPENSKPKISPISVPEGFFTNFSTLLNGLLRLVFLIAALLTFLFLLRAGFTWITSGGDRGKLESARSGIIAAVLGLIIVSASFAVLTLVVQFLGFDSLNQLIQQGLARK